SERRRAERRARRAAPQIGGLQAQGALLDEMPGEEGDCRGQRQGESEELGPGQRAAMEARQPLLDRPAIDVKPVREIAESRRGQYRQPARESEIDDEIA